MKSISTWKIALTFLLIIIATFYVIPNFTEKKYNWLPGDKVNLGLDLRGGSHLLLDVDFENESDFYDWLASHLYIHQQIAATLGL